MKKQPLFVAFTNQKGGVGKSAITVLMASFFHYVKGHNVLVVDCDFPQHSINAMRERDKDAVMANDYYKQLLLAQYNRVKRKAWPVVKAQPYNARQMAMEFIKSSQTEFSLVLVDLPGTVNSPGLFETLLGMDYIFVPVCADRMVMQSSLTYASILRQFANSREGVSLKGIYLIWSKIDNRVSREVFDYYVDTIRKIDLKVLSTVLPDSKRFDKELSPGGNRFFFRCTLHPPVPRLLKGSNVDLLADEIETIIKL